MNKQNIRELTGVAEAYEKRLAPALLAGWAHRVMNASDIQPGHQVLDVACGTGILARVVAKRVGNAGSVTGLDVNPGMLAVAHGLAPEIAWRRGDAEALPWEDHSFDGVLCQFGLMLFANPEAALLEMKRVARPGGNIAIAVFGSLDHLPAYAAIADIYERVVDKSVGDALRMPFSMGDPYTLESMFDDTGLGGGNVTTLTGTARFASIEHMVLADVKGWFPFASIHLDEDTVEVVTREAEVVLKKFQTAGGAIEFSVPVHIVTAVTPH